MKKTLSLILALLMLCACCALAEDESVWDFDTLDFALNGYTGAGGDVVIPDIIEDCTVDIIGLTAFNNMSGITSITLPDTVRQIEDSAISFCEDLASVELNDGLMIIGDNCFAANTALTEVTIPASVCYIGQYAFDSCSSLESVTFKGECPVFAEIAFDWLPADAVIYVPDDQFDAYAAAFGAMDSLYNLQPSGENAEIYDFTNDPDLFGIDEETGTVYCYEGFDVRVDVPAEINGVAVRAIDAEAFYDNLYMCYLTLPEGVEVIGDSAFEGCTRLVHVELPSTLRHIGNRAFAQGLQARSLVLPEGLESIGDEAFYWADRLMEVELPQSLKTIGAGAFDGCSWIDEAYIPASVESTGENAFANCGLSYVVFEGRELPEMPDNVFEGCWYLADIDLHTSATKQEMLDLQAVVDGLGLTCRVWRMQNPDVDYIYDGLDTYENGVLTGYTGELTHVRPWDTYDDVTVTAIGDGVFANNTTIEYFSVPYNDAFTTIGAEAFANSSLSTIDLFDSVTTINGGAFRNCENLTELTLPESVTFVGAEALSGCVNLKKLTVLCDPTVLPADLFDVWPGTLAIYAGENATDEQLQYLSGIAGRPFHMPVTRVGEPLPEMQASPYEALPIDDFWYDTDFARLDSYQGYELNLVLPSTADGQPLTMVGGGMMQRASSGDNFDLELPVVSVVIPQNYTEIPAYAFANCETLETVICYAPIEMLNDSMFKNCTALREVIFVNGVGGIGSYVFDGCSSLETVYVGPFVDAVSKYAFRNEFGETVWSLDRCITDPALMPDVDALLAAVAREPMTPPEPAPEIVAAPVGAEGEPFVGVWHGAEILLGDTAFSFADFGMVMTLMLCDDGRMLIAEEDSIDLSLVSDEDWLVWYVENGVAVADQSVMTIMDDGRLCIDDDGAQMLFVRDGDAPAAVAPAAPQPPVDAPDESGAIMTDVRYVCVNASMEGFTLDASMLGGEYTVTLHADGSVDFVVVGSPMPALTWQETANGFAINYFGTPLNAELTDDGFDLNYFDTMLLHFVPAN